MRKKIAIIILLTISLIIFSTLYASEPTSYLKFYEASQEYTKLLKEKASQQEINAAKQKMLEVGEDYINDHEDKVATNTKAVLGTLVSVYHNSGNTNKIIFFGEKLAQKSGLKSLEKGMLYLYLSDAYMSSNKPQKAKDYSDTLVSMAKNNLANSSGSIKTNWKNIYANALFFRANAEYINKNYDKAFDDYKTSYENYPSERKLKKLRDIAKIYYKNKEFPKALEAFKYTYNCLDNKGSERAKITLSIIASIYSKRGDKDNAFVYRKKLYAIEKNSKLAYQLGVYYNQKYSSSKEQEDLDKALEYWADSTVLNSPQKYSTQAEEVLKQYWQKKNGNSQDLQEFLDVAKRRVGIK